ncbi:hypothetical protein J1605_003136 [Eschrichtius robustus]|uniref:Uncharacterized protein n=1 Tax=Eschrichtius robustus TaxID=9764 RepID=A0AB34HSF6_ESCRO|nr:hypothetical protein J1605_003136 [Eschrichtius robustus]
MLTTTLLTDPTKSGGRPDSTGGPVLPDRQFLVTDDDYMSKFQYLSLWLYLKIIQVKKTPSDRKMQGFRKSHQIKVDKTSGRHYGALGLQAEPSNNGFKIQVTPFQHVPQL